MRVISSPFAVKIGELKLALLRNAILGAIENVIYHERTSRVQLTDSTDPTECARLKENVVLPGNNGNCCIRLLGDAALKKYTVPAQCPHSARTVPATVPAWEIKQCPRFFDL